MKRSSPVHLYSLNKTHNGIPRRRFIKGLAMAYAGITILPRHTLGGKGFIPPGDMVNIAIVGAGGKSIDVIKELFTLDDVQIISVADPAEYWKNDILYEADSGRRPTKKIIEELYSSKRKDYKISEYEDFRVMLEKEKSIDAVVCASPDNTHAYISITSMRAGKHVYCEKPLAHNIWEARKMKEVAREEKVATQMGNQGHSVAGLRQTVEYLRSGVIGTVSEVHTWVPATRWHPGLNGFPQETSPIPQGFNWDLWLGPSAFRPYNKAYTPVKWRDFWVFGCGALGDFGCHDMDTAVWAFDLNTPESVEVLPVGNNNSPDIAPYGEIGYFKFAANGSRPKLNLNWYSGGLLPSRPELIPRDLKLARRGGLYVGDKGIILNNGGRSTPQIFPESLGASFNWPAKTIPDPVGHCREWIDAIKGGPAALSSFDYASNLAETTLLGVLSLRLGGTKLYWDDRNMKATGLPEADKFIKEPVRQGWEME